MAFKVVTANRLRDGVILYLAGGDRWSEHLADAAVADGEAEEKRLLVAAAGDVAARRIVGPYAFEVVLGEAGPQAISQRERIRARGPSVRPDLVRTPRETIIEAARTKS
jgi:sulfite reductase (NADPH) hemoprotein beta-component